MEHDQVTKAPIEKRSPQGGQEINPPCWPCRLQPQPGTILIAINVNDEWERVGKKGN